MFNHFQKLLQTYRSRASVSSRGVTLIELLVVITIFGIIVAAVLLSNKQFDNSIFATNAAYDVALSIRQAQVYATAVRQTTSSPGVFGNGYGVFFSTSVVGRGSPRDYTFFSDFAGGVSPSN